MPTQSMPTQYASELVISLKDCPMVTRRQLLFYAGLGGGGAIAVSFPLFRQTAPTVDLNTLPNASSNADPSSAMAAAATGMLLPEFQGIGTWLNSPPLTRSTLKGSVVLVQFWTLGCINCQRTLPYIVQWHQRYAAKGLKVIGVHTPEFAYEREVKNIQRAMQQYQIDYTVAVDNAYGTWTAYNNRYWPHLYLADRQGIVRYDHIGEGAYTETEQTIQRLLG